MIADSVMIERAHHLAQSGANLIREQVTLIRELQAAGQPSARAEDFLILLQRAHSTFQHDLEFLRSNLQRPHP
jgi:hypothetical protein